MRKHLLPLIPGGLVVDQVLPDPERITIIARSRIPSAACPSCRLPSSRVHSRYERRLADLPWQGRPVDIRLRARKFFCIQGSCPRRTFAEHLPGVTRPSARRSERLAEIQRSVALTLGGEAGMRLASRLAMPVSADTLLRAVRSTSRPDPAPPRVLGVDEWAWRKGRRYGTILVDLERNAVVDLLPDRDADTFAAWLRDHPGVEVVARDRADVYADGARRGAPSAVHVADRWHLLRNLGEAVRTAMGRHHGAIRRIGRSIARQAMAPAASPSPVPTAQEIRKAARHTPRRARYEEVRRLNQAGASISAIARSCLLDCKTVRKWLREGGPGTWSRAVGAGIPAPHLAYLERRWAEGLRNGTKLWHELSARASLAAGRRCAPGPSGGAGWP